MRLILPYFTQRKTRVKAFVKFRNTRYSSEPSIPAAMLGPTNMGNLMLGLDIAESVAKFVPVCGCVLEGACGVLRKIVQSTEAARAARDECNALAEHTARITLAIFNEIVSASHQHVIPTSNIDDLCATINEVEQQITKIAGLGRFQYLASRGKINEEVTRLRTKVDDARIVFKIRNDISTIGLLHGLRAMQAHLASRIENIASHVQDITEGQRLIHSKLDMILAQVAGHRGGVA